MTGMDVQGQIFGGLHNFGVVLTQMYPKIEISDGIGLRKRTPET